MKNSRLSICLSTALIFVSLSVSAAKIYINPGHGAWTSNCRPMGTISYPLGSNGLPDTLGFYESNTNLWKCLYLEKKLKEAGHSVMMSRRANGGTSQENNSPYDKVLSVIATEAQTYGADYFISVHSNALDDGKTTNYPIFLYRGEDNSVYVKNSDLMAKKAWTYHFDIFHSGMETCSYAGYTIDKPNVRGDITFQNGNYTTVNGFKGFYGVLKHSRPGYLVEGYFHTYQPARHRALNPDWCCQEGLRYYRGIQAWFGGATETKGYIMGYIRTKEKNINQTYYTGRSNNDVYMPINGAKVQLRDASGNIIKTDCYPYVARQLKNQYYYTTDNNYNGSRAWYIHRDSI